MKFSRERAAAEMTCPICLEDLTQAVRADDGLVYDLDCIIPWIRKNGTSPLTREMISRNLVPVDSSREDLVDAIHRFMNSDDAFLQRWIEKARLVEDEQEKRRLEKSIRTSLHWFELLEPLLHDTTKIGAAFLVSCLWNLTAQARKWTFPGPNGSIICNETVRHLLSFIPRLATPDELEDEVVKGIKVALAVRNAGMLIQYGDNTELELIERFVDAHLDLCFKAVIPTVLVRASCTFAKMIQFAVPDSVARATARRLGVVLPDSPVSLRDKMTLADNGTVLPRAPFPAAVWNCADAVWNRED